MTEIELTNEQQQALQAGLGNPIGVVDPATQQHYILLAREQYERVRSVLEGRASTARLQSFHPRLLPTYQKSNSCAARPGPGGCRRMSLPKATRYCKRLGLWRASNRRQMEEQMKLQHFYGGRWIGYLRSDEGPVVRCGRPDRYRRSSV